MQALLPLALLALVATSAPFPSARAARATPALTTAATCDDAYLGVYLGEDGEGGARVSRVVEGSPAERVGLAAEDRILAVAGEEISGADALVDAIRARAAGEEVELLVERDGERLEIQVELGAAPEAGAGLSVEPVWAPLAPPARFLERFGAAGEPASADDARAAELEARLAEMRRQADERFAELERRLDEMQADGADAERLDRLAEELERDRAEREERFDELSRSIRRAIEERRAEARDARPEAPRAERRARAQEDGERGRAETDRRRAENPRRGEAKRMLALPRIELQGRMQPLSIGRDALEGDLEELRDEVRGLRDEIRALRELIEVR